MIEWLKSELALMRNDVCAIYLFGSALVSEVNASDIDIAVIVKGEAGSPPWERSRSKCARVKKSFFCSFGIPLSILFLTPGEWREVEDIIVRERFQLI